MLQPVRHRPRCPASILSRYGLVAAVLAMAGCDTLSEGGAGGGGWLLLTGPRKLSDASAFSVVTRRRDRAVETDLGGVLDQVDARRPARRDARDGWPSAETERMLRKVSRTRLITRTAQFKRDSPVLLAKATGAGAGSFEPGKLGSGSCSWSLSASEVNDLSDKVVVPNLERLPVRNQGQRGTCAAFTGVGALEVLALHPSAPGSNPWLDSIDLSEQRFYWLSKPECQDDGCPGGEEGSWYGNGLEALVGDTALPLELDCSYASQPGVSDTYVPQAQGCASGQAGVAKLSSWCGVRDLIQLLDKGFAVPYASPLSANWEDNDGLITRQDLQSAGNTIHAGGHAYLLVGYKRLPDMPEEGGICFIVRNSWGSGWGVNGYACMTLAWMQSAMTEFMMQPGQPVPTAIALGDALAGLGAERREPVDDGEVDEEAAIEDDADEDLADDESWPDLDPLPPEEDLDPDEPIERERRGGRRVDPRRRSDLSWQSIDLVGPNEGLFRVETAAAGDEQLVRGVKQGGKTTAPLRVLRDGERLRYQGDVVGRIEGGQMTLCTAEFAQLCSIRYRASDDQLYVQFRDEDLRAVRPAEIDPARGQWYGLGILDVEAYVAKDFSLLSFLLDPKLPVRVGGGEAARLSLRPAAGADATVFDLRLSGMRVGRIDLAQPTSAALCSGAYAQQCMLYAGQRLLVVPSNTRKR